LTRDAVIKNELCALIKQTPDIEKSFAVLRKNYPEKDFSQQAHGEEFRKAAKPVLRLIAEQTLNGIDDINRVILIIPWRAGLSFGSVYLELGVKRFYHLSSKRNEETLETVVDYEYGELFPGDTVIIADPMLATGNTMIDAIERVVSKGISPENILINNVLAAPIGVAKVKEKFPGVWILAGCLDDDLDEKGYIVPGMGDFGDKYFADMSQAELLELLQSFGLPPEGMAKIRKRMCR